VLPFSVAALWLRDTDLSRIRATYMSSHLRVVRAGTSSSIPHFGIAGIGDCPRLPRLPGAATRPEVFEAQICIQSRRASSGGARHALAASRKKENRHYCLEGQPRPLARCFQAARLF